MCRYIYIPDLSLLTMKLCFDKKEMGDKMKRNRRSTKNIGVVLTAFVFILTVPLSTGAVPIIGGDPIYTQDNEDFSGGQTDWCLNVYSYVFDETSSSLPGSLTLDAGEMLFMYLLHCGDLSATSVDYFSVGNPHLVQINPVGFEPPPPTGTIVPVGYESKPFQDPYTYGYAGPSQATVFNYSGNFFDPYCTLDPGEYSLVYYIAVAPTYAQVSASASGGGVSDNGLVPGPVPEPATILLLGLGSLALLRIRKR